jgi:Uri superfamily endonuclease
VLELETVTTSKGTYAFLLHLRHTCRVRVGRLGTYDLAAGYYLYVGSALGPGGVPARVARHMCSSAKLHWHIDYLRPLCEVVETRACHGYSRLECTWAAEVPTRHQASIPIPGFGSSDCRCLSHLFYFQELPALQWLGERFAPDIGQH